MTYKANYIDRTYLLPIVLLALGVLLLLGSPTPVHAAPSYDPGEPQPAGIQDPATCGQCHAEEYEAWQGSSHVHAFSTTGFQATWDRTGQLEECLACHTTGFSSATGQIAAAGVTCQACHTTTGEGHPPATMEVHVSSDTCGHCHASTLEEWQHSAHGQQGVECTACHQSHSQQLRVQPEQALCDSCHGEHMESVALSEGASESMTCNTCHMPANAPDSIASRIGGVGAVTHTFNVGSQTCAECHQDATHDLDHGVLVASQVVPSVAQSWSDQESLAVQAARERVRILEAQNEDLTRQVERHHGVAILGSAFGFGAGTFAGLVGALILVYVVQRRRSV